MPFPAGGPSDALARAVALPMGRKLGQPVVIENVGGAGGTIGLAKVAKAAADGYTPFASGVVVVTADLQITGTPKTYAVRASSGQMTKRSFCAECGEPLLTQGEGNPHFTSIRFPSLDDGSAFAPMLDIWTSRAQPWVCLDKNLPHFAESPTQPE